MAVSIKDETYFIETVVFQVENHLFKVPRYQFENKSETFASTSLLPTGDNKPEGSSRNFLAALYPPSYSPELSEDQWISILKLSTKWIFLDLRQTAIANLLFFSMTPQSLLLDCVYSSVELSTKGCSALVSRSTSLSDDEATELGYEMTFRLCILRGKRIVYGVLWGLEAEVARTFEKQLSVITEEEARYGTLKPSQLPSQLEKPVPMPKRGSAV